MALSEKKSQHPRRKRYVIFCGESYSSIKNQLEILKEGIETNFWHFNIFKDFVNARLDGKKNDNDYVKVFV